MKTLKNLWAHSKFTAIMLTFTTVGWVVIAALLWWGLAFIGASLGWVLIMAGTTVLVAYLLWLIWDGFAKALN